MLLVSSITPSGRTWALEAAIASIPSATVLDSADAISSSTALQIAEAFQVAGATTASPDLVASIGSFAAVSSLTSMFTRAQADGKACVALFPESVAAAVSDLQSLATLFDVSGIVAPDSGGMTEVLNTAMAIQRGEIELLLVCPPEESAVEAAMREIAAATACGVRVRGLAVCPMPRKSDGWPKFIRQAARDLVDRLEQGVHPIPVQRARGGMAPSFAVESFEVCTPMVSEVADGRRVWSITLPGLSHSDVAVGTWTADPAYPTTHVVLNVAGCIARRRVDATLRRCVPIDVVVSGDSIAITFEPQPDQWPIDLPSSGGTGAGDG